MPSSARLRAVVEDDFAAGAADGGGGGLGAAEHVGAVQRDGAVAHGAQPEALGGIDNGVRAAACKIQPGALRGLDNPGSSAPPQYGQVVGHGGTVL